MIILTETTNIELLKKAAKERKDEIPIDIRELILNLKVENEMYGSMEALYSHHINFPTWKLKRRSECEFPIEKKIGNKHYKIQKHERIRKRQR